MKVWESPFIPSHLTFKKVSNFTQFHTINQTFNQIYLFIITFQNLEFWDVTNLPPLETSLRSQQYSYTPSLFLTGPVFSDLQYNSFFGSSGSGITFSSILLSVHLGKVIPLLGLLSCRVWRQY